MRPAGRRRLALGLALPLAAAGFAAAAAPVAWEDLTEADWLYALSTRFAVVDGHRVHYPTPTAELARLLEGRSEGAARRHLADARLALGDRAGAVAAIEAWAEGEGEEAWAEAARWGERQGETSLAFRAAARALPGLAGDARGALAGERVRWADAHPEAADPLAMRAERARLLPDEAGAAEEWVRALEKAGRLDEATAAAESSVALSAERRLLLRSDLLADHGEAGPAFAVLDDALDAAEGWPLELKRAFARRADEGRPGLAESWRKRLESGFDAAALLRLATYFQGQERGDRAAELLRQLERRHERELDRSGWLLLSRLHAEIDSVPEAFRARLAAAATASASEQVKDLAALARLALRAGGRPLGWGAYNDEPYRWAARVDRTPGFWTGGISFLLTGTGWTDALERLESDSLPERTFATARALVAELERRAPGHAALFALRAAIMTRHVERGEGRAALALLPLVEGGPPEAAAEARRAALLAMRQTDAPLEEEIRLWRARLRALAPDGSRPELAPPGRSRPYEGVDEYGPGTAWTRRIEEPPVERYRDVLEEALARLDQRDPAHRGALSLILAEMDRLPQAEELWQQLAQRLESWSLDDEMGPRYERALERFDEPGWWARAARWYARRSRHLELLRLAAELAARFRSAEIFERAPPDDRVRLELPDQPRVGSRVRLAPWADWVRLKALERFPHSPAVFREARSRLLRRSAWESDPAKHDRAQTRPVIVDDALLDERGWAILFSDPGRREEYLAWAMREGLLPARLAEWEARAERTPVEELLIFEGLARLSRFEEAAPPADRLAALFPGDLDLARRVLSLQRSLAALDPAQAVAAARLVARTAPAVARPEPLFVELGELEHERGRPEEAKEVWRHVLDRSARDPARVEELATLLWDYGEMDDALATIEDARRRLGRPRLLAFEAGVLREEKRDVDGAVREYLAAGLPDGEACFCSAFERDQRALRRLSQLLGRERVRRVVEARLVALQPGRKADEETLVAFYPLATIRMPDAGLDWTTDDWIDALDHPVDPVAREARRSDRERWRALTREGQEKVGAALLERTKALVPAATEAGFLDAVERWSPSLLEALPAREEEVSLTSAVLARRAALAPTDEERVAREIARAGYLLGKGRRAEADAAWAAVSPRVASLPEGAPRMRAEAGRAGYLERAQGPAAAAAEWERLGARYPWSLGLLEDRLAFLSRGGRGAEGRAVLEAVIPRAAPGHREPLLERLAREAIAGGDLAQARRAADELLAEERIEDAHRLAAAHLAARLALRRDAGSDLLALARATAPRLRPESRAELHAQLARAAALESAWKAAVTLWIEALNRRLDRGWLREACRDAERGGESGALVSFFEKQRERSPRDVRWTVAVREIRLHFGDVEGALEAARAAIAVRPDRGSLWTEAAGLLARLGRPQEGAELLAKWAEPRPADEDAARQRSALLAAAGDGKGALAVERAALEAYAALGPLDENRASELAERRGRAARRLLDLGHPQEAFALLAPGRGSARLAETGLGRWGEAELALAAGRLLPLLRERFDDEALRSAAASLLATHGRPEQREEVVRWIGDEALPPVPLAPRARPPFEHLWRFAQEARLDQPVRVELARRRIARSPGPWAASATEEFAEAVAATLIDEPPSLVSPPLERLWVQDLVRRDRALDLWAFLGPRWDALVSEVRSPVPIGRRAERHPWTSWLDDRTALELFAEGAKRDPARLASLASVMAERRAWDRLWVRAARSWDTAPLVAALPDEARTAWFRFWQRPSPSDPDPVLRARGETVERAAIALGRLVSGAPGSASDPTVSKLRGPRTVGDVLGNDPRWVFPEFTPRHGPAGATLDSGEALVVGRGSDAGRLPGVLWGERPGAAWFVLEALARFRAHDPEAALALLEIPDRGGEVETSRLASRLAEGAGDQELALALADSLPSPRAADLERRVGLLQKAGRAEEAAASLREEVRRRQARLDEATWRALRRVAADHDLPDPAGTLDPSVAMPGPFVAALCELEGLEACRRFTPVDAADFRTALNARWTRRVGALSAEETRFALEELWANDAGPLPERTLRRLGGLWPKAGGWLQTLRVGERREAIAAVDALPDDARLRSLLARHAEPESEAARLLRARVHLLRGETEKARALFEERLGEIEGGQGLVLAPVEPAGPSSGDEDDEELLTTPADAGGVEDAFTETLRAWLAPFREAGGLPLVEASAREALLRRAFARPGSAATWSLLVATARGSAELPAILAVLERAWRRGDLDRAGLGPITEAVGRASAADADRWLARWSAGHGFDAAAARARVLGRLGRREEAASGLGASRDRALWTRVEEVKAFDLWRALASPPGPGEKAPAAGPEPWVAAIGFWTRPAKGEGEHLAAHLRLHPLDLRAARAALRTVAPDDTEMAALAQRALAEPGMDELGEPWGDVRLLRLRTARGLLASSPRSAGAALGGFDAGLDQDLQRRRLPSSEVRAAMADLARLATLMSDRGAAESALAAVEDLGPAEARALRAELRRLAAPAGPPPPWRLADGRPQPWRPRDLDRATLAAAVDAEGAR